MKCIREVGINHFGILKLAHLQVFAQLLTKAIENRIFV